MLPLSSQAFGMAQGVSGTAICAHKNEGPGLLESIREWCSTMELKLRGHFNVLKLTDGLSRLVPPEANFQ